MLDIATFVLEVEEFLSQCLYCQLFSLYGNVDLYLLERVLPLLFGIADFIRLLRVEPMELQGECFFGFLRSEATRLLLKLRAGLFEAAGYCIYAVPQIRYLHGHARGSQKPAAKHKTHGNRPSAMGGCPGEYSESEKRPGGLGLTHSAVTRPR
jgi:hypothetical protein